MPSETTRLYKNKNNIKKAKEKVNFIYFSLLQMLPDLVAQQFCNVGLEL
jgi:hypothetical protein